MFNMLFNFVLVCRFARQNAVPLFCVFEISLIDIDYYILCVN